MLKQPKKRILFCGVYLAVGLFLSTCGLEEYYFLPQVPQINISTQLNTSATINLPPLTSYYYAQNYRIFYRIYISGFWTDEFSQNNTSLLNNISPTLAGDYIAIYPNTDPTSSTAGVPAETLFTSRNYYELELEGIDINTVLTTNGGIINFLFPTIQGGNPVLTINNGPRYFLKRSNNLNTPLPSDKYFQNTSELNAPENANTKNNADVAGRTGISQRYAYVSMYIVAKGTNQYFSPIYSKPTHISVFRLPDN